MQSFHSLTVISVVDEHLFFKLNVENVEFEIFRNSHFLLVKEFVRKRAPVLV